MSNNLKSSPCIFSVRPLKENQVLQKQKSGTGTKQQRNYFERAHPEKHFYNFHWSKNCINVWIYQLRTNFGNNTTSILVIGVSLFGKVNEVKDWEKSGEVTLKLCICQEHWVFCIEQNNLLKHCNTYFFQTRHSLCKS